MGFASPEQQSVGDRFNIREYGRPACGITGHHLKKSVGEGRDGSVDYKRQGGHCRDQNPAEDRQEESVFHVQIVIFSKGPPKGKSYQDNDYC